MAAAAGNEHLPETENLSLEAWGELNLKLYQFH